MITAIGSGIGEEFDVTTARYHKVVLTCDADVDGAHIRTLILTFLFRHMKELIEHGYVYIAQPPLYRLKQGNDARYFEKDHQLEEWLIRALAAFGVKGERRPDRVGIWVAREDGREDKIAAIGVRIRHWVSFHGVALNVAPDLSHFSGIVPCGVHGHGVTSLADLGIRAAMPDVDTALKRAFQTVFGPVES
jgi:lipoate-protein ligase B